MAAKCCANMARVWESRQASRGSAIIMFLAAQPHWFARAISIMTKNCIKSKLNSVSAASSDAHCRHSDSASALHCIPGMSLLFCSATMLTPVQAIAQVFLVCLSGYYLARKDIADKRTQKVRVSLPLIRSSLILAGTQSHQCLPIHARTPLLKSCLLPYIRYDPPSISISTIS